MCGYGASCGVQRTTFGARVRCAEARRGSAGAYLQHKTTKRSKPSQEQHVDDPRVQEGAMSDERDGRLQLDEIVARAN
jgi:hypothetical protein